MRFPVFFPRSRATVRCLVFLSFAALVGNAPSALAAGTKEKSLDRTDKIEKIEKTPPAIELHGLLIPVDSASLSARSVGVIRSMKKEGDVVHAGDVVVSLEDDLERLSVESAQAVFDKRKFELESNEKLKSGGGTSEDALRTARTNSKNAEIQLQQSKVAQEHKTVVAPFDGVVTRRLRSPGEGVDQYNMQLINMVNLTSVYLETYLPANRLKDVQVGQPVEVLVADLPGRTYKGRIDFVAPIIDPASGEFRLKILVPNPDRSLRSGMTAVGTFEAGTATSDALTAATPAP